MQWLVIALLAVGSRAFLSPNTGFSRSCATTQRAVKEPEDKTQVPPEPKASKAVSATGEKGALLQPKSEPDKAATSESSSDKSSSSPKLPDPRDVFVKLQFDFDDAKAFAGRGLDTFEDAATHFAR